MIFLVQFGLQVNKHLYILFKTTNSTCPMPSKLTPSLFQFDWVQDLPENHFRVSGASWENIIYYYYYGLLQFSYV